VTGTGDEASGGGAGPHVKVFDGATQAEKQAFDPYPGFTGGVRVAVGDVNNDGVADIITGAGAGGGPHVKVFDGRTGVEMRSFFAYPPSFAGGVYVAAGDVNGDGFADIITGADAGGGPHVKVFDGRSNAESASFLAYGSSFQGGVRVAAGDVNGDGRADIITGAGPGGGPHVKVFDVSSGQEIASWLAYSPNFTGGVFVAAGDLDGDGRADIVTGADAGAAGGHVKIFDGLTLAETRSLFAYDPGFLGGVRVAAGDVNGDGRADIITGTGPGAGPHVKVFDGQSGAVLRSFLAYGPSFQGGVFVASGDVVRSPRLPSAINLAADLGAGDDSCELAGAASPGETADGDVATIRGGQGMDRFSILSSPFGQLTLDGGEDPDSYTVQFGRLAGHIRVVDAGRSSGDSLSLRGTEFAEQFELMSGGRKSWTAKWEGPDLNATGNEVAIETIEIAHEGIEFAEVDAGAGDDVIDASAIRRGLATQLVLRGGDGNDEIRGSRGADVLLGGAGDDFLLGLGGRDLLIGGTGADLLVGHRGDDILIAGTTSYDAHDQALLGILAEWTSTRNYQKRVANLTDGSGSPDRLNGSVFLNARTVRDDGDEDALTGDSGRDWFFSNADGDGGRRDRATDQKRNEIGVDIDL
jgi:Ca2+-binding RTX toxin-like protein